MKESKTSYSYIIEHMQDPSFQKVWDIAYDFVRKLPNELCNELHDSLNRGVDVLDSEPLLQMYIYSFGKMHKAKLQYAFYHLHQTVIKYNEIELVDYGCGQGLATICYHDFIKEHNNDQAVKRIILIEPSSMALSRAELLCSRFYPNAEIVAINKQFDELTNDDLVISSKIPTIHLLSNILDVESYDLSHFSKIVKEQSVGHNEYILVSPIQNTQRVLRLRSFAYDIDKKIYFEQYLDKRQLDAEKEWTCAALLCSQSDIIEYDCDKVFKEAISFIENKNKDLSSVYCKNLFYKLQACAEYGEKRCQNQLGIWYEKGIGTEQNYQQALEWYQKSAEQGYASAYGNLGVIYYNGDGVGKDYQKAVDYYTKGAKLNHPLCQLMLGHCYYDGVGVEKDYNKAFYWFNKAAEQGNANAQFCVGISYENGYGVKKDSNLAFEWYSLSAQQNNPAALNNLAVCYEHGEGTAIDLTKAIQFYEQSAKLGDITAQKNLANCFRNGKGVISDSKIAFYWTLEAAKGHDLESQWKTALYYLRGYGTHRSHEDALLWYAKYYADADENNLINNVNDAFNFFYKKADLGDPQALYIIGKCSQYGVSTNRATKVANTFFEKAAKLKHIESLIKVKQVSTLYELCSMKEDKNSFKDAYGVVYSADKKVLISASYQETKCYKIAKGTRVICNYAFRYKSFEKILIPSSVLLIGKNPFTKSVRWGGDIKKIECHSTNYVVSGSALYTKDKKKLISYFGKASKFKIPNGVKIIGAMAFEGNTYLTEVGFPNSLCSIEDEAFSYCMKLTKISLPQNVTDIGARCFFGCESLSEVLSLGDVKTIKEGTFMGCKLKQLFLPNSLVEIGDNAFNSTTELDNISLPNSIKKIGDSCFAFSTLSRITLNNNLQEIGNFCFYKCPIDTITIPSQVKIIGMNPFIGIKNVECNGNSRFVAENGLLYNKECGELISCNGDSEIALFPPIRQINSFAFNKSKVTDIFMGENIIKLEPWAFYEATKLERVIWKKCKIEMIPLGCFGECSKIAQIDIPSSVMEIQDKTFFGNCELKKIRFYSHRTNASEKIFLKERSNELPNGYQSPYILRGSTITDIDFRSIKNVDTSKFPTIEITVPKGCIRKYSFPSIHGYESYGMERNFIVNEHGND